MNQFKPIDDQDIQYFITIVGDQFVSEDPEILKNYSKDETPDETLRLLPEVVIKPKTTSEIQLLARYCFEKNIAITPRGAGSGLSGGAIPAYGGVVMSMERMNQILEIDTDNLMVVVEPGVITNDINRQLKICGLFYAGYPMSLETCQIGGNVAENAGGGKAVKYGVTGNYVRGVEFVTATGEMVHFGGKVYKDVSSYDIVHLMVGSEGTLGIITKIYLKVIPLPKERIVLLAPFDDVNQALRLPVILLKEMAILPTSLEFMNHESLGFAYKYCNRSYPFPDAKSHILIEIDGDDEERVFSLSEKIGNRLFDVGAKEVYMADNSILIEEIWKMRRAVPEAIHLALPVEMNEDISLPIQEIGNILLVIEDLSQQYYLFSPVYGHIGDGNLHVTLAPKRIEHWKKDEPIIRKMFYEKVKELGGVLSGEHGIGLKRKNYLSQFYSLEEINLMRNIKKAFDPKGILNPGKIFPDSE
jgi:glycolate oxidase